MVREKIRLKNFKKTGERVRFWLVGIVIASGLLVSCQQKEKTLKVAATPIPHGEMLAMIQPDLKEKGIILKIVEVDDYNLPNRLLAEKQVDANFFQHMPFLEEQEKQFGYAFVAYGKIHLEPLGIYSNKLKSLEDLATGAIVAIPNDPTNEARALNLLADQKLITLKRCGVLATVEDILENPKKLRFHEVDAPLLPRILPDVTLAIIPANFALQANLIPNRDALAIEGACSPYANILVIRKGDEGRKDLQILKEALTSEKIKNYLSETYKGGIESAADCKN